MWNSFPFILVFLYPVCCPAAPASELSAGRQWADQRALPLGPASICVSAETARSSHARQWAAWQRPHRWVCYHPDVWSHWRFGIFLLSCCFQRTFVHLSSSFGYILYLCLLFFSQGDLTVCAHRGCWTNVWSLWSKRSKVVLSLILRKRGQIHLLLGKVSCIMYIHRTQQLAQVQSLTL